MKKEQWLIAKAVEQIGGVRKLSRETGINASNISRCARGLQAPTMETQMKCARLLGVSADIVAYGSLADAKAAAGLD